MTRRGLLFACAALPLCADETQEVWNLFAELAAALSSGNAIEFLSYFARAMPGYQALAADVSALVLEADVRSSIELLSDQGDDVARTVEVDWYLQITGQEDAGNTTQRRERVRCQLIKRRKKWWIVSFAPLSLFAPPKA